MRQYVALKPVGRWVRGDTVAGLTDEQIQHLVSKGIIAPKPTPKLNKKEEVKDV